MKRHAAVLLLFLCAVLAPATRASARSLCVSIGLGGATIVFPKVKRLADALRKRPAVRKVLAENKMS